MAGGSWKEPLPLPELLRRAQGRPGALISYVEGLVFSGGLLGGSSLMKGLSPPELAHISNPGSHVGERESDLLGWSSPVTTIRNVSEDPAWIISELKITSF